MRGWEFTLAVDRAHPLPVFLQIAKAIADDVRRGRLKPGDRLPGTRTLARTLQVHRNTVIAAYEELAAEGWTTAFRARATFIARALPDPRPRKFASAIAIRDVIPGRVTYDLRPAPPAFLPVSGEATRSALPLAADGPDVRLFPASAMARAYRRALRQQTRTVLGHAPAEGHPRLRAALADMLTATRAVAAGPDSVMVTRGSQMALALAAFALFDTGHLVVVEDLGVRAAWEAFRLAGARVVAVPVDREGLRIDSLRELARREPIRAVYVTPHHQYPTTVTLSPRRRIELLELAREARFAIIEDDYDHEFCYEGRPVLPLASVDRCGCVIYVGTLSTVLAPGLRIGYVVAPVPLLEQMSTYRAFLDAQGDHAVEAAVAELLEDGELRRHLQRARRIYASRRDLLIETLRAELGGVLTCDVPSGGTGIWAHVDPTIDVDLWAARGPDHGVVFHAARRFAFDGRSRPYVRLGFCSLDETELREAVRRMARALPSRRERTYPCCQPNQMCS